MSKTELGEHLFKYVAKKTCNRTHKTNSGILYKQLIVTNPRWISELPNKESSKRRIRRYVNEILDGLSLSDRHKAIITKIKRSHERNHLLALKYQLDNLPEKAKLILLDEIGDNITSKTKNHSQIGCMNSESWDKLEKCHHTIKGIRGFKTNEQLREFLQELTIEYLILTDFANEFNFVEYMELGIQLRGCYAIPEKECVIKKYYAKISHEIAIEKVPFLSTEFLYERIYSEIAITKRKIAKCNKTLKKIQEKKERGCNK